MQLGNTGITLVKEYNSVSRSSLGRRRSYGSPSFGLRIQWQSINTIQNWSSTNRAWPLPAYSLEQIGPKHSRHHLPASMFIIHFLWSQQALSSLLIPLLAFPQKHMLSSIIQLLLYPQLFKKKPSLSESLSKKMFVSYFCMILFTALKELMWIT